MTMREAQVRRKQPAFMTIGESFYGSAFGPTSPKALARSIADWSEMTPEEQTFAIAHLHWLNLQAQAEVCRQLGRVCRLLDDVTEAIEDLDDDDGDVSGPEEPDDGITASAPQPIEPPPQDEGGA